MITWKTYQNEFKPATLNQKLAIAFLAGATAWLFIERLAWLLTGRLKFWF